MRKVLKILLILTLIFSMSSVLCLGAGDDNIEFKATWVSTVFNLDYPTEPTKDIQQLKDEADQVIQNAKAVGFNGIILQVRPCCDAFYNSSIFPTSKYLTGTEGATIEFDPLAYFIEKAHKENIQVHAWINPYRVTKDKNLDNLSAGHIAKTHPEYVKEYEGGYYLDPGLPQVNELVKSGVKEILDNYDVDGIHFDDYFYPGEDFPDSETYAAYGKSFSSIGDWRRNNIDTLIKDVGVMVRSYNKVFGVSPAGIWANSSSNSLGSETNGRQSYFSEYADSRKWVKENYIDYICPQIYWEIGNQYANYNTLVRWWSDVTEGTDVKLYIGMAAYKTGAAEPDSKWYGYDEIIRQMDINRQANEVSGEVMFRYNSVMESELSQMIADVYVNQNIPHTDSIYIETEEQKEQITFVARLFESIGSIFDKIFSIF